MEQAADWQKQAEEAPGSSQSAQALHRPHRAGPEPSWAAAPGNPPKAKRGPPNAPRGLASGGNPYYGARLRAARTPEPASPPAQHHNGSPVGTLGAQLAPEAPGPTQTRVHGHPCTISRHPPETDQPPRPAHCPISNAHAGARWRRETHIFDEPCGMPASSETLTAPRLQRTPRCDIHTPGQFARDSPTSSQPREAKPPRQTTPSRPPVSKPRGHTPRSATSWMG